ALRFRAWLRVVVVNEVRSFWRSQARRPGDRGSGDPAVHQALQEWPDPGAAEGLAGGLDGGLRRDLGLARGGPAGGRGGGGGGGGAWDALGGGAVGGLPGGDGAARLGLSVGAVYEAKRRVGRMLRREGERLQQSPAEPEGPAL